MITVYCVTDNKPGHKSQLTGLLQALENITELQNHWLAIDQQKEWQISSPPDLIIAAGSHTHLPALILRYRHGGKLVVLMKPLLPRCLFDLCLIPKHDGLKDSRRVVTTLGAINPVVFSEHSNPTCGLILIGGPSKHYSWSNPTIISQLLVLKTQYPDINWTLTTSRRTPSSFLAALGSQTGFTIVPLEQTDSQWLSAHYQQSGVIWVTEDSVSMVYESLSSGASTGVFNVPRLNDNRVSKGLDALIEQGRVMRLGSSENDKITAAGHLPLREADRAATIIKTRLLTQ